MSDKKKGLGIDSRKLSRKTIDDKYLVTITMVIHAAPSKFRSKIRNRTTNKHIKQLQCSNKHKKNRAFELEKKVLRKITKG